MNELFIKQFFSEKGELSQSIEDYRLRQEQVDISVLIDEAITNKKKLIVDQIFADEGPKIKRIRPRAQGRAYKILKPTCHITVVLKEIN